MSDVRELIQAAYRKLSVLPEKESLILGKVSFLAQIEKGATGEPPIRYRLAGRAKVRSQLDDVAKAAEKLAEALEGLYAPSIAALADNGFLQLDVAASKKSKVWVDGQQSHRVKTYRLPELLQELATIARTADISAVPEEQGKGRLPNNLAKSLGSVLAFDYHSLTGHRPIVSTRNNGVQDVPYGPFFDLVSEVFTILDVQAKPEHIAREAVKEFKERNPE